MQRPEFEMIAFDWDGTLMDSTPSIRCIQEVCRDFHLPVPAYECADRIIGFSLYDALQIAVPTLNRMYYSRFSERYRYHHLRSRSTIVLFEGVRELLDELHTRGCFLTVATGKSRVGLNRALEETGLMGLFDATRCADETFSKPHPSMLQELALELGQDLSRTVMIGDTTDDLQMAKNAGAASVGVCYGGAYSREQLEAFSPNYIASSVFELYEWLLERA
ncbi:HAD-IA family hydrolase [Candidatus Pandoraea novymonadis]|uniref:Pyrophosphatase PpaX n=1 Tax=Candidatus Pandoraea novymonadis TaxID=1808959 RepID=A0ABX5FCY8_9BURK|nr:HAD-IA family hydrolase [Candidatus Pandoraea novymonadis]PSB91656.1 Pyrophosphatase PpaX [Candidatus Pandoraea novymonadis]